MVEVDRGKLAELEERLAKVEARIAEEDAGDRLENRAFRIAKTILFLIAITAAVVWGSFELISLIIDRLDSLRHSLGW